MGLGVTFAQGTSVNIIRSIGLAFFFLHRGLSKCWPHSGSFLPPLPPAFSPCFSSRVEGVVCPVFYPFSPCFEAWTPHRCRTPPPTTTRGCGVPWVPVWPGTLQALGHPTPSPISMPSPPVCPRPCHQGHVPRELNPWMTSPTWASSIPRSLCRRPHPKMSPEPSALVFSLPSHTSHLLPMHRARGSPGSSTVALRSGTLSLAHLENSHPFQG